MEVVVTTGAVRRSKLQWECHHQQTNTLFLTGQMPFLSPNQQCQSNDGKYTKKIWWLYIKRIWRVWSIPRGCTGMVSSDINSDANCLVSAAISGVLCFVCFSVYMFVLMVFLCLCSQDPPSNNTTYNPVDWFTIEATLVWLRLCGHQAGCAAWFSHRWNWHHCLLCRQQRVSASLSRRNPVSSPRLCCRKLEWWRYAGWITVLCGTDG